MSTLLVLPEKSQLRFKATTGCFKSDNISEDCACIRWSKTPKRLTPVNAEYSSNVAEFRRFEVFCVAVQMQYANNPCVKHLYDMHL